MLHEVKTLLFIFISLAVGLLSTEAFAATKPQVVCSNSKGALIVRKKCRSGEQLLSSQLLSSLTMNSGLVKSAGIQGTPGVTGPQGAAGSAGGKGVKGTIDFSGCRLTAEGYDTNFFSPASTNVLSTTVSCDPNTEFLFDESYLVRTFPASAGTKAFVQVRSPFQATIVGDTRDYAVTIYANRESSAGSGSFSGAFELLVTGICCPR